MSKVVLAKGDLIAFDVGQPVCNLANPCDTRACLQTLAAEIALNKRYGRRNFYVKSDAAGIRFTMDGYRYYGAFDRRGVKNLVKFDRIYKLALKNKTKEEAVEAARAAIAPYKSSFIIMTAKKIGPKNDRERKDQINALRNEKNAAIIAAGGKPKKYGPYKHGTARELSL